MPIRRIECTNCGEKRIARKRDDGVDPVLPECPECGASEFESVIH